MYFSCVFQMLIWLCLSGVVLKMARLTYDSSLSGQKGAVSKPPIKTLVIPGNELVQLVAKVCSRFQLL